MVKSKFTPIVFLLTIILLIPILAQAENVTKAELQQKINSLQNQGERSNSILGEFRYTSAASPRVMVLAF